MSTSPHKRLKGCCGMCGHLPNNTKDNVQTNVKRKLGQVRRFTKKVKVEDE